MPTTLLTVLFRGSRRVRLIFTDALAAGAFTATTLYTVTSVDGLGANPTNVEAVFQVLNTANAVELSVDADLVGGGQYQIGCTAVPVVTGPAFTGTLTAQVGLPLSAPVNAEPAQSDLDLLLYNRDIVHDGNDFVEDASGDLATIDGRDNFIGALKRRMVSAGLTWDTAYGARANEYVNAPDAYRTTLAGSLLAQARADNRTKKADVAVTQDPVDPDAWNFTLTVVGRDNRDPVTITVPPNA